MGDTRRIKSTINSYQIPYIALMTILAIFFLLMYVYYKNLQTKTDKAQTAQIAQDIRADLASEKGLAAEVKVEVVDNTIRIVMPTAVVFDLGAADIKEPIKPMLTKFSYEFAKLPSYYQVYIEGHTDDGPVWYGGDFSSNWELSLYRSISLIDFFAAAGCDANRFVGMGYGQFRPLITNDTKEHRSLNRRVEIIVKHRRKDYVFTRLQRPT